MDDDVLSVRIPRKDTQAIDRLVREGDYVNRSDFVRHAVRQALADVGDDPAIARLGMDVGANVPAARSARRPRGLKR